jgi:nucleoid DNA-binding protein
MSKSDMVRTIADELGLTYVKTEEAVEAVLETIKETLSQGEPVILRRFGSFEVHAKHARQGRNPKTGEPAEIAARSVVRFKAGNRFKAVVNRDPDAI